jgi:chaperone required for assembly of F1-ATPase
VLVEVLVQEELQEVVELEQQLRVTTVDQYLLPITKSVEAVVELTQTEEQETLLEEAV